MSSQQVQYLQKQIQRRDAQIRVLLSALDGLEAERDASQSIACAFAWDLSNEIDSTRAAAGNFSSDAYYNATVDAADCIEEGVLSGWADALAEASK